MAQKDIDTLKRLRAKIVEQRRALALRQSNPKSTESVEGIIALQAAIEATDRAITDEKALLEVEYIDEMAL
jgi:hypothetical protein